ncbi:MAG TPA: DUF3782 domain-containing protein [Thermoanaerobaculia bacterium]|nr:DUF3782 domain-containing protein [Thermoanaerobaculia bacterium]
MTSQERAEWDEKWNRSRQELVEAQKETDRQLKELGKQLGGLGDKFGSFTEGLALPSMTKILGRDFHMDKIAARVRARNNGHSMEIDVLAYSRDLAGDAVIVEVKSHLREDGLEQMRKILRDFRDFFPEHAHRKIYGILAVVDAPDDLREKVLREGIYLARIHDGQFEIQVPESFQPRAF